MGYAAPGAGEHPRCDGRRTGRACGHRPRRSYDARNLAWRCVVTWFLYDAETTAVHLPRDEVISADELTALIAATRAQAALGGGP